MVEIAERQHPLLGLAYTANGVTITPAGDAWRTALRAPTSSVTALSKALGVELPQTPKSTSTGKNGRMAAWLGPDEWLVIDDGGSNPLDDLANVKQFHSAVDVSHRNIAIMVEGAGAAMVLNGGCPQDLSLKSFPVGAASRTMLGKAEVVLIREREIHFRIECWRSFSDYAFTLLSESARGAAPA